MSRSKDKSAAEATEEGVESLQVLDELDAQEEQEMDPALKAQLTTLEARLQEDPPREEIYIVGNRRIHRKIIILRVHGRFQTFLISSGKSNKGSHSYPGLCYPITHITTKIYGDGVRRRWYGKQSSVCLMPDSKEYAFKPFHDMRHRFETDDLCLKPGNRLFKWQYFLFRDFVRHYDPNAWDWLLNWSHISRQSVEVGQQIKRVLYKLVHSLQYFRKMSTQYFATEEQIVCSAALSLEDSAWGRPELIDLREFIRQRDPDLFTYYRAVRDREGIVVTEAFLRRRMEARQAILLRRTGIDYRTMLTERNPDLGTHDETHEQTILAQMLSAKHVFARFEPLDEDALQEPIFSPHLPPYEARYGKPLGDTQDDSDDSLQPDTHARRSRSRSRSRERLGGTRYTRKVHFTYPKRKKVRGRTVSRMNLFRTRKEFIRW
jgi:hypothetical protein